MMSAHWTPGFSGYQANGRGRIARWVGKRAPCSDLDSREDNPLPWEELIPPGQALLEAWLAASLWLPLLAGKVHHCCLLRAVSKSTVAPCQGTASVGSVGSGTALRDQQEHNGPVWWQNLNNRKCWDQLLSALIIYLFIYRPLVYKLFFFFFLNIETSKETLTSVACQGRLFQAHFSLWWVYDFPLRLVLIELWNLLFCNKVENKSA